MKKRDFSRKFRVGLFEIIVLMFVVVLVFAAISEAAKIVENSKENMFLSNKGNLVTLEGTSEVIHYDYFNEIRSENFYYLKTLDGTKYKLNFLKGQEPNIISGRRIIVSGVLNKLASRMSEFNVRSLEVSEAVTIAEEETNLNLVEKKIAIILVNYNGDLRQPITKQEATTLLNNVKEYYLENSYNNYKLLGEIGDIYGYYTISEGSDIIQIADSDIFYPNYDRIVILYPENNMFATEGSGAVHTQMTNDGEITFYIARATTYSTNEHWTEEEMEKVANIVKHELGHLITYIDKKDNQQYTKHADGYECGESQISESDCSLIAYNDPYDVMGGYMAGRKQSAGHMNSILKENLKWVKPNNVITYNGPGNYLIRPLEIVTLDPQIIKIPITINGIETFYYLEYRQFIGQDATLLNYNLVPGVLIHLPCLNELNCNTLYTESLLIDATPQSIINPPNLFYPYLDFTDASLTEGNIFKDISNNIRIQLLESKLDHALIYIGRCYTESDVIANINSYYTDNIGIQELSKIIVNYINPDSICNR